MKKVIIGILLVMCIGIFVFFNNSDFMLSMKSGYTQNEVEYIKNNFNAYNWNLSTFDNGQMGIDGNTYIAIDSLSNQIIAQVSDDTDNINLTYNVPEQRLSISIQYYMDDYSYHGIYFEILTPGLSELPINNDLAKSAWDSAQEVASNLPSLETGNNIDDYTYELPDLSKETYLDGLNYEEVDGFYIMEGNKEINKFEDNMQYSLQFITDNLEKEEQFFTFSISQVDGSIYKQESFDEDSLENFTVNDDKANKVLQEMINLIEQYQETGQWSRVIT